MEQIHDMSSNTEDHSITKSAIYIIKYHINKRVALNYLFSASLFVIVLLANANRYLLNRVGAYNIIMQIGQKRKIFELEIRRAHRSQIIGKRRSSLIQYQQTNTLFQDFVTNRDHQIPMTCVQRFSDISSDSLAVFRQIGHMTKFIFNPKEKEEGKQNNEEVWFFDCRSMANIKFAIKLGQFEMCPFFEQFVLATIESNKRYLQFQLKFELMVSKSKCYIISKTAMLKSEQAIPSLAHQIQNLKESQQQTERVLQTLKLWTVYLRQSSDSLLMNSFHFQIIMKSFSCWMEHFSIQLHREPYEFADEILSFIISGQFIKISQQRFNSESLKGECELFIEKIKFILPYVLVNTDFPELAFILIKFYNLNSVMPGIFFESVRDTNSLKTYVLKLLSAEEQSMEMQIYEKQLIGIKLLYYIYSTNSPIQLFSLSGVIKCLQILADKSIFNAKLQQQVIPLIRYIIEEDVDYKYQKIIAGIDFCRIMTESKVQMPDLFEETVNLVLVALKNYKRNRMLTDKIIINCDLQHRLRQHCRNHQDYDLYESFVKIINSSMDQFIEYYRYSTQSALQFVHQFDFDGKQEFITELQEHIKLKQQEQRL